MEPGQQVLAPADQLRHEVLGSSGHVEREDLVRQGLQAQRAHREAAVGLPDVEDEKDPGAVVEPEHRRGTAAGRRQLPGLVDQPRSCQQVQALDEGGAGHAREVEQLGAGRSTQGPDQGEQVPRGRPRRRSRQGGYRANHADLPYATSLDIIRMAAIMFTVCTKVFPTWMHPP